MRMQVGKVSQGHFWAAFRASETIEDAGNWGAKKCPGRSRGPRGDDSRAFAMPGENSQNGKKRGRIVNGRFRRFCARPHISFLAVIRSLEAFANGPIGDVDL
jgi:hypothetical protein